MINRTDLTHPSHPHQQAALQVKSQVGSVRVALASYSITGTKCQVYTDYGAMPKLQLRHEVRSGTIGNLKFVVVQGK